MKKVFSIFSVIVAIVAVTPSTPQAAESHLYFGVDHAEYSWDVRGSAGKFTDSSSYALRLGYDFNNIIGIEGHFIKPGEFPNSAGSSLTQRFEGGASLYLRANMRFERTTAYLLGGATYLKDSSGSDTGYGYGAGFDFFGTKNAALTLSYISNYNSNSNSIEKNLTMLTLGFTIYLDPPKFNDRY